jgi:hypothetical protein
VVGPILPRRNALAAANATMDKPERRKPQEAALSVPTAGLW